MLIETLAWHAGGGFQRLDRHLARLAASAETLGFAFDRRQTEQALAAAVRRLDEPHLRVRLTLGRTGELNVETASFEPQHAGTIWTAIIAAQRLDALDPLLRHKISKRDIYDLGRAEAQRVGADESLFLNQRDELCEGGITSLFIEVEGGLLTPPLECGLLAGVLRQELLDCGKAREAVLTLNDLKAAQRWYLGNSLRGLIPARLHTG